jgi:hypothetical protein
MNDIRNVPVRTTYATVDLVNNCRSSGTVRSGKAVTINNMKMASIIGFISLFIAIKVRSC